MKIARFIAFLGLSSATNSTHRPADGNWTKTMRTNRTAVVLAVALSFAIARPIWATTLIGTQVTGALYFVGYVPNYFDPTSGHVPGGYLNAAGPTVTISSNAVEFGYADGTTTVTADFTAAQLIVTYVPQFNGNYNPIELAFTNAAFSVLSTASDGFPYGGLSTSLSDGVIILDWAGGSVTSGQRLQAVFNLNLPAAPPLEIQLTSTNTVVISWPASSTGFNLQQNSGFNPLNWMGVTTAPVVVNGRNQVIVPHPVGTEYYRLSYP